MTDAATDSSSMERRDLARLEGPRMVIAAGVGVAGLVLAVIVGALVAEEGQRLRMVLMAYLTGLCFFLSVSLGALFFVLIQHLTRAGWSVSVRRLAELMAANLALLAVLALPVVLGMGVIYEQWFSQWAAAEPDDPIIAAKVVWLNPGWFVARMVLYFVVWVALAWWYWRQSVAQDLTGDRHHTEVMQRYSGIALVLFALTVNFAAFDLIMSLDAHWYSTIFGVYFFAGGMLGFFAAMIVLCRWLQRRGILTQSVTVEHYHDLGKWLFGFVFFWGYIAFSQFMLLWYASIPEGVSWFNTRGATTHDLHVNAWTGISVLLLVGHLFVPFAGLLSRWPKRWVGVLVFWAVWLLFFHYLDVAWMIMPEVTGGESAAGPLLAAALAVVGVGGIWVAGLFWWAADQSLLPVRDPRLNEALAFHNV